MRDECGGRQGRWEKVFFHKVKTEKDILVVGQAGESEEEDYLHCEPNLSHQVKPGAGARLALGGPECTL